MYYSTGNYEAYVRPERPKDVSRKSAYIIGSGMAGLTAAFYLVRDGQMKGSRIHILERQDIPGGSCDERIDGNKVDYMPCGRQIDEHCEILWDVYRDIPSIEQEDLSVLDEFYRLNKHDSGISRCRATQNRGEDAGTKGLFTLDKASARALSKLFLTPEKDLECLKIKDVMPESFWRTNFWLYWQTAFAFQKWSSALEMKRYLCRFVHQTESLPNFKDLKYTKYNQYESMILPLVRYLEAHDVSFSYEFDVKNIIIDHIGDRKIARQIVYVKDGVEQTIDLEESDLVFVTNGCAMDSVCYGDQIHAPDLSTLRNGAGASFDLWNNIAAQAEDGEFGSPDNFCSDIEATNWMSAVIATADEDIIQRVTQICRRDPRSGKVTTGGIITVKDSIKNWYMSWMIGRQPQFSGQSRDMVMIWLYGLNSGKKGNYIKKPMRVCNGEEICQEWLYHIGMPEEDISRLAKNECNTTTCFMPFVNAFLQPRKSTDRPKIVPDGSVNFAFIGQFAETARDTVFTMEYAMRTGMEAVYTLLDIDRGVPEVWGSKYDIREILRACYFALDQKQIGETGISFIEKEFMKVLVKKMKGTDLEELFQKSGLIS